VVNTGVGRGNRLAERGDELQCQRTREHLDQMCSRTLFYTLHAFYKLSSDLQLIIIDVLQLAWLPA
jgi:hypothetical protein